LSESPNGIKTIAAAKRSAASPADSIFRSGSSNSFVQSWR
jgi:hypothetical protein